MTCQLTGRGGGGVVNSNDKNRRGPRYVFEHSLPFAIRTHSFRIFDVYLFSGVTWNLNKRNNQMCNSLAANNA
jgi:hypothetical protein